MTKLFTIAVSLFLCAFSINDYKDDASEDSGEEYTIQALLLMLNREIRYRLPIF